MKEFFNNHRIESVWKTESAKIVAALTRMVRNIGMVEDLAQDTLIIALERWPVSGIPDNPGAWLMTVTKRKDIDLLRRKKLLNQKYEQIPYEVNTQYEPDWADFMLHSHGTETGLEIVDSLLSVTVLKNYHLLSSVKGNFLLKLGRMREAFKEFQRAASLTQNIQEHKFLLKQARECVE